MISPKRRSPVHVSEPARGSVLELELEQDIRDLDRYREKHLPLHVQFRLEPMPPPSSSDEDSQSLSGSECTNPHLKDLMDRYFQSDDEEKEFDADGESEAEPNCNDSKNKNNTSETKNKKKVNSKSKRRKASKLRGRHRKSKNGILLGSSSMRNSQEMKSNDNDMILLNNRAGARNTVSFRHDNEHKHEEYNNAYRNEHKHEHEHEYKNDQQDSDQPLTPIFNSKVIGQKVHFISGEMKDHDTGVNTGDQHKPPVRTGAQRYNAWDSSPSTVEEDQNTSISFDMYFNPIDDKCGNDNGRHTDGETSKRLFSDGYIDQMSFDVEDPNSPPMDHSEVTDDSDLELTQRSRQIQYDLRLRELTELAVEAERAAEAGDETFKGLATRFELGLGLDVGENYVIDSPPRRVGLRNNTSWSVWENFDCNAQDYNAVTPVRGHRNTYSEDQPTSIHRRQPNTELKKPKAISNRSRQKSAPSKLQTKKSAISNIPSLLTSATFLSVAPTTETTEKIPVLALRHIEEVIPSFQEMHSFMKMNLSRCGVKDNMMSNSSSDRKTQNENEKSKDKNKDDADSSLPPQVRRNSLTFMRRVPSFQMIMKSMSGLSRTEKSVKSCKSDDEISYDVKVEADSDLSIGPDEMALDCVSFVSCGDISEDIVAMTPEKKSKVSNKLDASNTSDQQIPFDVYACTLATELHDPREKISVSPLPKAPYGMGNEDNLQLTPHRSFASSPRSRWSTFWENISPAKKNLPTPSPVRMQLNRNSWSFAGNSVLRKPVAVGHRSSSDFEALRRQHASAIYFQPLANNEGMNTDASWEVQKAEGSNDVIISSRASSQTVLRMHHPHWIDEDCRTCSYDDGKNVAAEKLETPNTCESKCVDENNIGNDQKGDNSKGSFRTSTTTQMSCDESQSSAYSKFSDSSQRSQSSCARCNNNPSTPPLLTIRPVDATCEETPPFNLVDPKLVQPCLKDDSTLFRPPLHPAAVLKFNNSPSLNPIPNSRIYNHINPIKNAETQFLATIEASVSIPDFSDDSSGLRSFDRDENLPAAIDNSLICVDSVDHTTKKEETTKSICQLWQNQDEITFCEAKARNDDSTKASLDILDDGSIASADEDENNKSTMSFIDLMEKVPSVIKRFRPFSTSQKTELAYRDDSEFVENYFFTGIKPKKIQRHVEMEDTTQNKHFFGENACLDLNCVSVMESALTCLIVPPQRNSSTHSQSVFLRHSSSHDDQLVVGNRIFKTPNLSVSKRSLLDQPIGKQSFESSVKAELSSDCF